MTPTGTMLLRIQPSRFQWCPPRLTPQGHYRLRSLAKRHLPARLNHRGVARALESEEGPLLERLDVSSSGGLGGTSDDVYGPLAILLVGFQLQDYRRFQALLQELGAEMVSLIPCPPSHLNSSLEAALKLDNIQFKASPLGLRRTVFLSGMYASEVQEIVGAYQELRLPPAVFAACVPRNKDKRISDLVEEVYDDHEYMLQQRNPPNPTD